MRRAAVLLLALAAVLPAARLASGPSFTLGPDELQLGDIYYRGPALRLDGRVEGSVVAACQTASITGPVSRNIFIAAQTITLDGPVSGDVTAIGQHLAVGDTVAGAVRALVGTAHISGRVARDLIIAGSGVSLARGAEIEGTLIAAVAGTLTIDGIVRGDVRTTAREIIISGLVDGDVICTVEERILLTEDARIFGGLRYSAEKQLELGNRDAVFGPVEFDRRVRSDFEDLKPFRPDLSLLRFILLPFAIVSVLGALAVAFLLVAVWKRALLRAFDNCLGRFGRTVGTGALALFATPAAALVALALVITFPVGLVGGTLWLVCLYLAKVIAGLFVGRWLFRIFGGRSASIWLTTPVGVVLVYALCGIPVLGWLVWLFAALIGFGVIVELLAAGRRV